VVDLPEDEPEIVARALTFIYTGEYSSTKSTDVAKLLGERLVAPTGIGESTGTENATETGEAKATGEATETSNPSESSNNERLADSSESSTVESGDARRVRLRISTLTYQMADKFGLRELQLKTLEDFRDVFQTYRNVFQTYKGSLAGLNEIVALVYDCTASDDQSLRRFVTSECVESFDSVEEDSQLLETVKANEPMAWSLARDRQQRINTVELKLRSTEHALYAKTTSLESVRDQFNTLKRKYDDESYQYKQTSMLLDSAKKDSMTTKAAIAKHCPHCGEGKLVLVKSDSFSYYAKESGEVTTNCLACQKKWKFKAAYE
jgi:hypothetical protein